MYSTKGQMMRFASAMLLLLALSLQIAIPVMDGLASSPIGPAGSFAADLSTSLCHDASTSDQGTPVGGQSQQTRHCLFCLPLMSGHATQTAEFTIPAPKVQAITALTVGDQQEPLSSHYILAYSRAPPAAAAST